jgi:hypothetical protein
MTTLVGIFDRAQDLDNAIERLAGAGFEDTVYDEAIVGEELGNFGPSGLGAAPGFVVEPYEPTRPDRQAVVRAFQAHLSEYDVPDNVIKNYATAFYHGGKFILVKTENKRAEQVKEILSSCRASQVNQHP